MKIAVGCDEDNAVIRYLMAYLSDKGHNVQGLQIGSWAEMSNMTVGAVLKGETDIAIVMCWSGTGVSIAANKNAGIRAALCWDAETARLARKWNDANVLCLSQRWTSQEIAKEIVDAFMSGQFDEEDLNQVGLLL